MNAQEQAEVKPLPCPFCGKWAKVVPLPLSGKVACLCENCEAGGDDISFYGATTEEAVLKWNTRFHMIANALRDVAQKLLDAIVIDGNPKLARKAVKAILDAKIKEFEK